VNLHGIAASAIGAVNPLVQLRYLASNGYTTAVDGTQVPAYLPPVVFYGQVQSLTYRDLVQTEGLNLNGVRRAIYLSGTANGIVRAAMKGGDYFVTPDNYVWLVNIVLEAWPSWTKLAVTLQDDNAPILDLLGTIGLPNTSTT
jgi:hypothetical protein